MSRQIYSLMRLTTSLPARDQASAMNGPDVNLHQRAFMLYDLVLSWRADSDRRPADYKSAALPTELRQRTVVPPCEQPFFKFQM